MPKQIDAVISDGDIGVEEISEDMRIRTHRDITYSKPTRKQFADKFHHDKEEDILFAYAKGNIDIINVMLEDHKKGRYYVKSVLLGLETGDAAYVSYSLKHYRELLTEHIKKEDEILYPWIEKGMTPEQIAELEEKFDKTDLEFGNGFYDKWEGFVSGLEKKA